MNSYVTYNIYKKTAIIKFWKHIYLPMECNVKVNSELIIPTGSRVLRKHHLESGPLSQFAIDIDLPLMELDNFLNQRETDP